MLAVPRSNEKRKEKKSPLKIRIFYFNSAKLISFCDSVRLQAKSLSQNDLVTHRLTKNYYLSLNSYLYGLFSLTEC